MAGIEYILFGISVLILLSIAIARATQNLGVPTLILFLGVGMLAGVEGPGGIEFTDTALAQAIGCLALMIILFSGGLDTRWTEARPLALHAGSLATLGVFVTATSVGLFVSVLPGFGFSLLEGLLLGAVISSTDAAAVFAVLRSRNVHLRSPLKPLLELESGSNDPMAVFLTVALIEIVIGSMSSAGSLIIFFLLQMSIGTVSGFLFGRLSVWTINHLKFPYEGIYPVFALAFATFVYSVTTLLSGSGFLAVYIAGIILGNSSFVQKKTLLRFFDGLAWLSQIGMFIALGLHVIPSHLIQIVVPALAVALFLMFVARPFSVFLSLARTRYTWREKSFISWVGLRGAAPIILATFPLLAGIPSAEIIFSTVFFIVLTSALLQGWSIPKAARLFGVDAPPERKVAYPIEAAPVEGSDTELVDLSVPHGSGVAGKTIIELELPRESLIVLIGRDEKFLVPSGSTVLEEKDTLLVLTKLSDLPTVRNILSRKAEHHGDA